MTQVFAYLRVSTDAQDVANHRYGVIRYCAEKQLLAPIFVGDTASGRTEWRARPLGQLVERSAAGEVIMVHDVSRLARSTLQVLEIGKECPWWALPPGSSAGSPCFFIKKKRGK